MKLLTILFLLCSFLQVNAQSFNDITIKKDKANLETVFLEIEKQSEFRFFFNETLMKQAVPVTIDVKQVSLNKALDVCFEAQPKLTYAIVEKTIIVKRREVRQTEVSMGGKDFGRLAELRGMVTSDQGPVPEATITVKGTEKITKTNNAGEFLLYDVDDKAVLVVTHVSHHEQEVRLNGRGMINISLSEKVGELEEQVVLAYNKAKKKTLVGAVTVIKGEQVQDLPYRSIDKSLQGLVPGLQITNGTGQPGGGVSNIVLRGISTGTEAFFGSTVRNPLFVVDGVPITTERFQYYNDRASTSIGNPMAQINPSDIESITVLKDAAAISLYGSKASNGVILITTKTGKSGKATLSLRHQTNIAQRLKGKVELLNQQEYLEFLYEKYKSSNPAMTDAAIKADLQSKFPTLPNGDFYPEQDWRDEIFSDKALTLSNEISVSGGNEKSNYYLNLEYTKQDGIVKNTGYDRKSLRFNFENRPTEWLKFGINTGLSYNIQEYVNPYEGAFGNGFALVTSPLNPVRNTNGALILNYNFPYKLPNPVAEAEYNTNKHTSYRGISRLFGEIKFLKYFTFSTNSGIDFSLIEIKEKADPRLFDPILSNIGPGRINENTSRRANVISTNMLRFDKTINEKHAINLLISQEAQIMSSKNLITQVRGGSISRPPSPYYNELNSPGYIMSQVSGNNPKQTLLSYFGQANYSFDNKYFFSSSLRSDGASRFGGNQQWGTFWSVGAGWLITGESFMKKAENFLNYLKIRGSIGAAGSSSAVDYITRYDGLRAIIYQGNPALIPLDQPGNPDIRWEQTFTWDAGLEARLFNNRVAITADIYNKKTTDLIYSTILPSVSGHAFVLGNIGDMKNQGIELSLSAYIIRNRNFKWNINANWSSNQNKLVKANVPLAAIAGNLLANEEGRNFNSFYLKRWAGVNPDDGRPMWIDSTGQPNTNYNAAKREFVGQPQPKGFGALGSSIEYRDFQLSASFYYHYGAKIYNEDGLINDGNVPFANQRKEALDHWRKPGDVSENPRVRMNNTDGGSTLRSTRFLYDADYIRLQNLTLTYNFPRNLAQRIHLSMLRVYVQGNNLAIWTKYPSQDPDNANVGGSIVLPYPNQRSFSFGLNANF